MPNDPLVDALPITELEDGVRFDILVAPRASRARLGEVSGGRLKVAVNAPPVDGKANAAVVEALAAALGVRKADVSIVAGQRSKRKSVRVMGLRREALLELLSTP